VAELILERARRALDGREIVHFDHALPAEGADLWFDSTLTPLTEDTALWTARDATERKQAESSLREREEQLIGSQRMESVGRLAGGIAHDFNNLLTVIMGFGELLQEQVDDGNPARQYIDEIVKAGERAEALTRQLLAFSRRQVLAPAILDLNMVVSDLHSMLAPLIGEDVELTTVLALNLGRVRADQSQLQQVVVNLAANARDAMPNGGTLTIETANVDLDGTFAQRHPPMQPGAYVLLAVSDTGVGMNEDTQAHLFEPFFTTKERGRGTGLGLSTVYGIVKQSGGYIWVESAPREGTTFSIYLPRLDDPATPAPPPVPSAVPAGTETILLVEDEDQVRVFVEGVLRATGYTVLAAARPEQALTLADRHGGTIHLLLTDLVMPGLSGREVAERVTTMRPTVKTLYMSGYTDDVAVRHGVAGSAYIAKPFTPAALAEKVRSVLDE
jgi:signal transduction histidine kinase